MSERFIIDCYGIIDTWKRPNGDCRDKLSWSELCDTLNELDRIAEDKLDNYEYVTRLEKENLLLKEKIMRISDLLLKVKDYTDDIEVIIETCNGGGN